MSNITIYLEETKELKNVRKENPVFPDGYFPLTLDQLVADAIQSAKAKATNELRNYKKKIKRLLSLIEYRDTDEKIRLINNKLEEFIGIRIKASNIAQLKRELVERIEDYLDDQNGGLKSYRRDRYNNTIGHAYNYFYYFSRIKFLKQVLLALDKERKPTSRMKIKWLGTASQFGYLFKELVKKGFIEVPKGKRGKEKSIRMLAQLCHDAFSISDLQGIDETSFDNLYMEMTTNSLTEGAQHIFRIKENNSLPKN